MNQVVKIFAWGMALIAIVVIVSLIFINFVYFRPVSLENNIKSDSVTPLVKNETEGVDKTQPASQDSSAPDNANSQKTYSHSGVGVSFTYPANLVINQINDMAVSINTGDKNDLIGIIKFGPVFNCSSQGCKEGLNIADYQGELTDLKTTTVDGHEAITGIGGGDIMVYSVRTGDYLTSISYNINSSISAYAPQIISSIKFK